MNAPRLLLVEDDPALAELLEFRFRQQGYAVTVTADGDEALLLAAESVPDLVVLDWMVEGTSGIEVCRRLRKGKATAHVPIVMLTARDDELWQRIRYLRGGGGAVPGPLEAWLLLRGMRTLPIRVAAACSNAMKIAQRFALAPQRAVSLAKRLVNAADSRPLADQLQAEREGIVACVADPDFSEGVMAFVEKRKADFPSTRVRSPQS